MDDQEIRVLSIDDNPGDALLIKERLAEGTLTGWGLPVFVVEWVNRLEKGLARLEEARAGHGDPIDVVLTDLDLPDSRAGETFATLRQRFPLMPIVVLTGREDEELARTSVRAGAQDYLFKAEANGGLLAHALIYAIERQENARTLQKAHDKLERRVEARTAELQEVNSDLRDEIGARAQAEQALARARDQAERYLNIAPSIIVALDTEGQITLLNEMGADILECDQQTAIGKNWFDTFLPERARDDVRAVFQRLMAGDVQPLVYVENVALTGEGNERFIRWHNTLLRAKDGEIVGLLSSGEDFTAQKQVEAELRERVKEQTCLYAVSRDIQQDLPMDTLCRRAVEHLVKAMQFPEITVPVIDLQGERFTLEDEAEIEAFSHGLHADLHVNGETCGHLAVYYTETRPFLLPEEQDLVMGVAEALSIGLERKRAEEALREREARLRFQAQLLDNFRESIMATDLEGRIIYWSKGAEALYGYRAEEVMGELVTFIVKPESEAEELERLQIVRETGSWYGEYRQVRKDGAEFWADTHITLVMDEDGNPSGMIGIDRDITARKRAEAALHEREELLADAQRIAHLGSWEMDVATGESRWSDEFFRICGYEPGAVEANSEVGMQLIHPDDRASTEAALQRTLESGAPYHVEKRVVRPSGEVRDVVASAEVVRDAAGEPVKLVGTLLDITDRKRAEGALRRSEELYQEAQRIAHLGSWEMDIATSESVWSDEFFRICGYEPGSIKPTAEIGFEIIHPDDRERAAAHVGHAIETGEPYDIEKRIVRPDGTVRWVHSIGEVIYDDQGEPLKLIGSFHDITEQKRVAEALRESEEKYRTLFEAAQIGIVTVNRAEEIETINPFVCDWLGYSEETLLDLTIADISFPEDLEKERQLLQEMWEGERDFVHLEKRYLTKQGEVVWGDLVTNVVYDAQGNFRFGLGMVVDITARKRVEAALRRREQELSTLVENADDTIVRFDTELRYTYCNPAVERNLGVPITRFLDKTPREIGMESESAEFIMRTLRRVLETGESEVVEQRYTTPRGLRYYHTHIVPERNPEGQIESLLAISRDITERKQAEEALREANRGLEAFFEHSPHLVSIFDQDGRYRMVNPALVDALGRPQEDIVGQTFADLLPPEVANAFMCRLEKLMETNAPLSVVDRLQLDGERRMFETTLFPLSHNAAASGSGLFGSMAADVTQREEMEQALRESRERLSLALDGAELGMWDWNIETGELVLNERWAEMLGYTLADVDPHIRFWGNLLHPDDAPVVMEVLDAHLEGHTPVYQTDYRLRTKSGKWKWILDTGKVLLRDEDGQALRAVGTHQDITERKRAEEKLKRYADNLKRSNDELERFAHVISHDLHEPARMVKSYLELLERRYQGQLDEKAHEYIDYAVDGAARMQEMIDALLNLFRVGTQDKRFLPTDVERVVKRTLTSLDRVIEEAGAEVFYDPLPTVLADKAQLAQVFQNLIANAIKFRRDGVAPEVYISSLRQDNMWVFSVVDNGIGIDPEQAGRIFQIFQRLHTREEYPGLGMGLALSKRIVEHHGGRIWVEPTSREGATFRFSIPVSTVGNMDV